MYQEREAVGSQTFINTFPTLFQHGCQFYERSLFYQYTWKYLPSLPDREDHSFLQKKSLQCMQLSVFVGKLCWKHSVKHPAKGRKLCPFSPPQDFRRHRKCKKFCLKKIFNSCSIKTSKINVIVFNIERNLNLEFEL